MPNLQSWTPTKVELRKGHWCVSRKLSEVSCDSRLSEELAIAEYARQIQAHTTGVLAENWFVITQCCHFVEHSGAGLETKRLFWSFDSATQARPLPLQVLCSSAKDRHLAIYARSAWKLI